MGCAEILPRSKHLEGFREAEIGVCISIMRRVERGSHIRGRILTH